MKFSILALTALTPASVLSSCPSGQSDVVVEIDGDVWSGETSWDIVIAGTSTVVAPGGNLSNSGFHTWSLCLPGGDYTFTIYDSFGDGMGGSWSDGSTFFAVYVDGVEKFKVDGFSGDDDSRDFTVPMPEPPSPCAGVTCSNAGKCQVTSLTTALCQCEDTFVPSESGLKCICPDGLDFHANVNRCLPPPTAAPTNPPTKSPTVSPTASPIVETEKVPDCVDDMSGTFKLFNVMEEVECSWLTKNKDKTEIRKNKYCGIDKVKRLCQSTCGACTKCDDKEGTFTLLNVKKTVTCDWLTKNKSNTETRKGTYCPLDEVRDMCKASCGACADAEWEYFE